MGVVTWLLVGVNDKGYVGVLSVLVWEAVGCTSEQVVVLYNEGDTLFAAPAALCS